MVAEYVKAREVFDFQMTGRQRRDLFISYIAALERHELKMPRLEPFYREPQVLQCGRSLWQRSPAGHGRRLRVGLSRVPHRPRTG